MITKSVLLVCGPARAFELFTNRISEWWPPERRHTGDPKSTITLAESGRFFERGGSGNEVELGAVISWHAPEKIVLDWYPGTDKDHPTRVEIRFAAEGDGTRITVDHGPTEASEDLFPMRAPRYEASWTLVFHALVRAAADLGEPH
ncbi:MAG: hypothetical protein HOV80_32370 [Polyangiaceae bacterium]|nr:hypothetical protein [Polyangiaceae bacterium]